MEEVLSAEVVPLCLLDVKKYLNSVLLEKKEKKFLLRGMIMRLVLVGLFVGIAEMHPHWKDLFEEKVAFYCAAGKLNAGVYAR